MDEKDWLILKTLYEKKSITRTAEAVFMSQPALSTRLQQIENRFDTVIVMRGKKGVQFTPEGEFLAHGATKLLRQIRSIEESLVDMREKTVGTLRIGASNFASKYVMPELLCGFKARYPAVEFHLVTGWSSDIVRQVYNNDLHIGFVRGEHSFPGQRDLLFNEKMYVCSMTEIDLERLPGQPCISYRTESSVEGLVDRWWDERFTVPPYVAMQVDRVDTSREMVAKGLGYAFLPEMLALKLPGAHAVEMRFRSGEPLQRATWMIYHKSTLELKLVRAFVEFVKTVSFR